MIGDLAKLQGTWTVTSLEKNGTKVPLPDGAAPRIVIDGSHFTSSGMGEDYQGIVELHRVRNLPALDLVFTDGPEKRNRNLGIYKLTGDRWTICLATRGTVRPRTFATEPGSGIALETLQRGTVATAANAKPRSSVVPALESSAPATILEGEWAMVSAVFDGKPMAANMAAWAKRITRGDLTMVVAGPQTMLKATFTIDESKRPSAIDYVNVEGPHKGNAQAGIFALDGDALQICMAPPGKPRPASFASKAGDGRSFTTWRRVTSAARS
jgi:uncharacterized protein (TIGR03067 family)